MPPHKNRRYVQNQVVPVHVGSKLVRLPIEMVFDNFDQPTIVVLCAEPGLGRRDTIRAVLAHVVSEGGHVVRKDFSDVNISLATRQLVRLAHEVYLPQRLCVIGIDRLPMEEANCIKRQIRALRRLVQRGASVVLSVDPEHIEVLELLPEAVVLSARDLLLSLHGVYNPEKLTYFDEMTRGISCLAKAFSVSDKVALLRDISEPYCHALKYLISATFRSSLSENEIRLRLALLLLGSGQKSDVEEVCGETFDNATYERLGHMTPFFGIDSTQGSFSCIAADNMLYIDCASQIFECMCEKHSETAQRCLQWHMQHRRVDAAAKIVKLCGVFYSRHEILDHAVALFERGELDLLEQVVLNQEDLSEADVKSVECLRILLRCAQNKNVKDRYSKGISDVSGVGLLSDYTSYYQRVHESLQNPDKITPMLSVDDLTHEGIRRLFVHTNVMHCIAQGRFLEGFELMLTQIPSGFSESVSGSFCELDKALLRHILLEPKQYDGDSLKGTQEFVETHHIPLLRSYAELVRMYILTMRREVSMHDFDELIPRVERSGSPFLHVFALCLALLYDAREGAYTRALIRVDIVRRLADKLHSDYFKELIIILRKVVLVCAHEEIPKLSEENSYKHFALIEPYLNHALGLCDMSVDRIQDSNIPYAGLWVLYLLLDGFGKISQRLEAALPYRWKFRCDQYYASLHGRDTEKLSSIQRMPGANIRATINDSKNLLGEKCASQDSFTEIIGAFAPVTLRLFGGFELYVHQQRVADWHIEQRSAKTLLALLACSQAHRLTRSQLAEYMWPEDNYLSACNKMYQATSVLRNACAEIDPHLRVLITSRASQSIGINSDLLNCDVDIFKNLAHRVLEEESDVAVLDLALHIERLYRGSLWLPARGEDQMLSMYRYELSELYVESLVRAVHAAESLGKAHVGLRWALHASLANPDREDAMLLLVGLLKREGRIREAESHYRRYLRRLKRQSADRISVQESQEKFERLLAS